MSGDSNKTFIIGSIVTVVLFIGGVFLLARGEKTLSTEERLEILSSYSQDNVKGGADAQIEIVEFSDFQCPACAQAYANLNRIMSEYGDQVRVAFRHLPLRSIHPNAQLAAVATETAAKQQKFWELHDILFQNQAEWSALQNQDFQSWLVTKATEIGIEDIDQFNADLEASTYAEQIDTDVVAADELGLRGTPTIYVNGEQTDGFSYEAIKAGIEKELT